MVWMCVSDTAAVDQVLFGPDGVESVLEQGMVVVDSSTISPTATLENAKRVRAKGADYVDAPVTGSKIAAASGQLIFIVGGTDATVEHLGPLFAAMGKKILRLGETGKGQACKLGGNLMIALMYQGLDRKSVV